MQKIMVVNVKHEPKGSYIYIGRPSIYGKANPGRPRQRHHIR